MGTLITAHDAGKLLNRSAQIVRHWAKSGRLKSARRSPLRFRLADVVAFTPPPPRPGSGRPRRLQTIIEEILSV